MKASTNRFYKTVDVAMRSASDGDGAQILLDTRPIRTPGGRALFLPSQACAEAIAAEWRAQGKRIDVNTMPLTQLANTALDRIGPNAAAMIDMLLGYAGADLLCYRAEAPADLALRQHKQWQPLLDWAAVRWDAHLTVTSGIIPVTQPAAAMAALNRPLAGFDAWELTVAAIVTQTCGSLILALALLDDHIDADTAFALSQLDETYQCERWGEDYEAARRRRQLHGEIGDAYRFMLLTRGIDKAWRPDPPDQGEKRE